MNMFYIKIKNNYKNDQFLFKQNPKTIFLFNVPTYINY